MTGMCDGGLGFAVCFGFGGVAGVTRMSGASPVGVIAITLVDRLIEGGVAAALVRGASVALELTKDPFLSVLSPSCLPQLPTRENSTLAASMGRPDDVSSNARPVDFLFFLVLLDVVGSDPEDGIAVVWIVASEPAEVLPLWMGL